MQMKCSCGVGSKWIEQAPTSTHRYRVECPSCRTFVKWGAQIELDQLIDAGEEGVVVSYEEDIAGQRAGHPTLDKFMKY